MEVPKALQLKSNLDGDLFLAEENGSMSPKYYFEVANSNYTEIYYYDETGTKKLP